MSVLCTVGRILGGYSRLYWLENWCEQKIRTKIKEENKRRNWEVGSTGNSWMPLIIPTRPFRPHVLSVTQACMRFRTNETVVNGKWKWEQITQVLQPVQFLTYWAPALSHLSAPFTDNLPMSRSGVLKANHESGFDKGRREGRGSGGR